MRWVVRLLGAAVAPVLAEFVPTFLYDASKTHTHATVFAACRRAGLLLGLVPLKMTWLLQPSTSAGFCLSKHTYRGNTKSAVGDWQACVCAAIRIVLQGLCWAPALDAAGYGPSQSGVSDKTKAILGVAGPLCGGATRPSAQQLRTCFPKRTNIPSKAIQLAWEAAPVDVLVLPPAKAIPKPVAFSPTSSVAAGYPLGPRLGGPRPPPLLARALRRSVRSAATETASIALAVACPSVAAAPRACSSSSSSRPPP